MFGSFIAGLMVGDSKFRLGQSYGYALLLESFALLMAYIFIKSELVIGEWIAAFACGLQNALATSFSGFTVRTTHMTGIVTGTLRFLILKDIGNILGQACRIDTQNAELWRLKVLIPLLISYLLGAIIGQVAYSSMKDNAMIFPFLFTGSLAIAYFMLPVVNQAKEKLKNGFKRIESDIEKKSHFEGHGAIFHADKDQTEILPSPKINTNPPDQNSMNDNESDDVVIM
jgi:uncharacterized membrane protein YoaK (UPF0700 family)